MPTLQQHQLRVAAVARMIYDSLSIPLDKEGVVNICLFHDMGNIIKFDLSYFPDFIKPEGLDYWQNVKNQFVEKYGKNEHIATEAICRELGLCESQLTYLNTIGFTRAKQALESESLEQMICCYADQRVGPHGMLSIEERLEDGRKRYANRKDHIVTLEQFDECATALKQIEEKIFNISSIKPEDITDEKIKVPA